MKEKVLLVSPHMSEEGYEMNYIKEAFDTNWIAPLGENVNKFEEEICSYTNAKYGCALSSGTAALHMALKAVGVDKGDIVFCQSLTFSATANPILYQGAIPVFIDSEKDTWNISPEALKKAFEKYPHPKAVVIVHLYGTPAKLDEIIGICKEYGTPIIEDAAESLGAIYKGKHTGTFGTYGAYSFNGNKIITTSGGGMIISDSKEKNEKINFWVTQAREPSRYYQHNEIGYNYRLSNILAGIGRGQLKVLDRRIEKKTEIYNMYKEGFKNISEISMQPYEENTKPNHWLSVIYISKDSKVQALPVIEALEKENIEARPVWKPMHMQPVFEIYDFISDKEFSVSQELFEQGVCLPSDTKMSSDTQQYIIDIIQNLFREV